MDEKKVSIVIPAHNEEKRVGMVLEDYGGHGHEIIVVNNGSTDGTPEIVLDFAKQDKLIHLLDFQEKLGKGGAIMEGFKRASGGIVGFVDADESTKYRDFRALLERVSVEGIDGVIASRWIESAVILQRQPLMRRIASRIFNILVRIIFGLPYRDTQCGAKVFRKSSILAVSPEIKSKGFEFDVELLWRLKKEGFIIEEIPITWSHEGGSRFSLLYGPKMVFNLLRLRAGRD